MNKYRLQLAAVVADGLLSGGFNIYDVEQVSRRALMIADELIKQDNESS